MKILLRCLSLALFFVALALLASCGGEPGTAKPVKMAMDEDVTTAIPLNTDSVVTQNEKDKALIESKMAAIKVQEADISKSADATESMKQKWTKALIYKDSSGNPIRIKLMPHPGISERSEEFYYKNGAMFFVFIADKGAAINAPDEGKPGKELHFAGNILVKYDDKSGDKETDEAMEKKRYESTLPIEAAELLKLAGK